MNAINWPMIEKWWQSGSEDWDKFRKVLTEAVTPELVVPSTSRERFEAAVDACALGIDKSIFAGEYVDPAMQLAWHMWQARDAELKAVVEGAAGWLNIVAQQRSAAARWQMVEEARNFLGVTT